MKKKPKLKEYFVSYVGITDDVKAYGCFIYYRKPGVSAPDILEACAKIARNESSKRVVITALNPL